MADAAYVKVRADRRVRSGALLVAIGLAPQGRREVIGVSLAESETGRAWADFLRSLVSRGLSGVRMVTSDANEGLVAAAGEVPPGAAWQRCQAYFSRNVCEAAPKGMRAGLRGGAGRDARLPHRARGEAQAGSAAAILHTNSDLTSPDRRMAARV